MTRRRLLAVLATVAAAVVLPPAAAGAHAVLEETNPADGAVLDAAPSGVTLQFNEIVSVRDGAVSVIGPDGNTVETDDARAVDRTVHIDLPPGLGDGSYVVSWRVISADSHPVTGAFVFSIGAPTSGVAVPPPGGGDSLNWRVSRAAVTSAAYLGVLVAAGLTIFTVFVHDGGHERRRLRRLALMASVLGAVGVAASVPIQVVDYVGDGTSGLGDADAWGEVTRGPIGIAALVSVIGLIALVGAGRRSLRNASVDAALGAGAVAAVGGFTIAGHTRTFGPWWLVVGSDLVHLSAAAIWLGGLIGLVVMLRTRRTGDDEGVAPTSTADVVSRFSTLAAMSLVLVAAVGVVLGWRILGSWSALFGSDYGTVLLVKIGLVAVVAALGGYNRFRLIPRTGGTDPVAAQHRLSQVVRAEAALLIAVVTATGVLVNASPTATASPGSATAPTEPVDTEQVVEIDLGDVTASLVVEPGRIGTNRLVITLDDQAGDPVEVLEPPTIELTHPERGIGPLSYTGIRTAAGVYEVDVDLPVPGRWGLRASARTSAYSRPIGVTHVDIDD